MKLHKNIIYNTFRCKTLGKNETLNDILRGTKSVLKSKNGFKEYISNYNIFTKVPTFKNPNITDYPLLKADSAFLNPIKKNNNYNSPENPIKIRLKPKIKKTNNNFDFLEKYQRRFYKFLNLNSEPKKMKTLEQKVHETKFKRYNSLFLDFFNKWNKYDNNIKTYLLRKPKYQKNMFDHSINNNNKNKKDKYKDNLNVNMINFNIEERYSRLHYDENEIFNKSYEKFILKKIRDIKENKINNYTNSIDSTFNDLNEKEIKLKLVSIKLHFYPQINNKNINTNVNKFSFCIPLSYVFLFYYNNFDFFQKILMSILYFDKDYKKIILNDEKLYNLLDTINTDEKEENKEEKDFDYLEVFKKNKKNTNEQNNLLRGNYRENVLDKKDTIDKEFRKTFSKHSNIMNKLLSHRSPEKNNTFKNDNRKIKIIHSNISLRKKYQNNNIEENKNNNLNNSGNNIKNQKETDYNEYYFIWETPKITYKVKMEMPKIFFLYEDIEYKISTYCEKKLFLYLYKHNFINWDFYVLNYIVSIKSFRNFISQFFSINEYFAKNTKMNINLIKNLRSISTSKSKINLYNLIEVKNDTKNNKKKIVYLVNKKINNQMNENNESYIFFYTDSNLKNCILNFHSYHINIEYKKLNPKQKWEFLLNFKQMKYLNEVSKYDNLILFLPKIIKTNFEYGTLDINFNVFDDNFDIKIFNSNNKILCPTKKNLEINIEINMPYVEMEKYLNDDTKIVKKELDFNFLQNLSEIEFDKWSKHILLEMNKE